MLIDMPHLCNGGFMDGLLLFKREQDKAILKLIQNTLAQNTVQSTYVVERYPALHVADPHQALQTGYMYKWVALLTLSMCGRDSMSLTTRMLLILKR